MWYPPNTTSPPSSFLEMLASTRREGPTAASHDDQVNADPLAFLLKERSNMAKANADVGAAMHDDGP